MMIRIWFLARPLVLGATRVRENWFSLAFILRTSCQPMMSLASATFCRFFAALAQRRATDRNCFDAPACTLGCADDPFARACLLPLKNEGDFEKGEAEGSVAVRGQLGRIAGEWRKGAV